MPTLKGKNLRAAKRNVKAQERASEMGSRIKHKWGAKQEKMKSKMGEEYSPSKINYKKRVNVFKGANVRAARKIRRSS